MSRQGQYDCFNPYGVQPFDDLFVSAYFNSENEKQHPDQYGNDIVDSAQILSS